MSVLQNPNMRMVLAGNGLLQEPISREILELTGEQKPNLLMVGTPKATAEKFDEFKDTTRQHFTALGANVTNMHDFDVPPSAEELADKLGESDAIWVAGGDTLRAVTYWQNYGIDVAIGRVASNTVISGGSAGMLAWFDYGHSDSMSYRVTEGEPWEYMFVNGLGYIAATGCPHYDGNGHNAPSRGDAFKAQFAQDGDVPPLAIAITNRAALSLNGTDYRVIPVPDTEKPAEVHILRRQPDSLDDYVLPITSDYQPFVI